MIEFKNSETIKNLMKAFAGESQARNRYTFAASVAKKQKLHIVEAVFTFTAKQEKEHAEIFYGYIQQAGVASVTVDGEYPVDIGQSVVELLKASVHNEFEEWEDAYPSFAQKAREEGFTAIAEKFELIAKIEKTHGERFGRLAEMIENNTLFVSDNSCAWMCINCGHIHEGTSAPGECPVCDHNQGYFIRNDLSPVAGK